MTTVLALGDLHAPFQHPQALEYIEELLETYQPDEIVQVGDMIDIHACSRHDPDPDGSSSGDELGLAIDFCKELAKLVPEMTIALGNHDLRFHKAAFRAGVPAAVLRSLDEIVGVDGWEWVPETEVDGVLYIHGTAFGGEFGHVKAAQRHMQSVVMGHTHTSFGVEYIATRNKLIFGANAGCLIDHRAYAFAYAKEYPKKSILGSLIIEDGQRVTPVPMFLGDRFK